MNDPYNIPDLIYNAWRRSEAYGVPMTAEGQEKALKRLESFAVGFRYGLQCAATKLERMHSENKQDHKFYYKASVSIKELLNGAKK